MKAATRNCFPPLVHNIRSKVKEWRDNSYAGASATSIALLNWWFMTEHVVEKPDGTLSNFRYYFAQREAIETVIYLYEVAAVKDCDYPLVEAITQNVVKHPVLPDTASRAKLSERKSSKYTEQYAR